MRTPPLRGARGTLTTAFVGLLVAVLTVIGTTSASEAAQAAATPPPGRLVYVCGTQLCVVNPATGAKQQLTTDGEVDSDFDGDGDTEGGAYSYPDITPDGSLIAAERNSSVMVGAFGANLADEWASSRSIFDVATAQDASAVTESHIYGDSILVYCGGPVFCLQYFAYNYSTYTPRGDKAGDREQSYDGGPGATFTNTGSLISATTSDANDLYWLCRVDAPALADQPCVELFASTSFLGSPDSSPDGSLVAVDVTPAGDNMPSSVQIFSAVAGQGSAAAPLRVVADNADSPAFSPDGTWIAYASADGWIYAVPTAGGTPVKLVQGKSPTWGGGVPPTTTTPVPTPGAASLVKPKGVVKVARNNTLRFTVVCAAKDLVCAGTLTVKVKGKALTKPARYSINPGSKGTVKAKLTKKGVKALRKGKVFKVSVGVKGGTATVKVRR